MSKCSNVCNSIQSSFISVNAAERWCWLSRIISVNKNETDLHYVSFVAKMFRDVICQPVDFLHDNKYKHISDS